MNCPFKRNNADRKWFTAHHSYREPWKLRAIARVSDGYHRYRNIFVDALSHGIDARA